jgi:hypothetical protein
LPLLVINEIHSCCITNLIKFKINFRCGQNLMISTKINFIRVTVCRETKNIIIFVKNLIDCCLKCLKRSREKFLLTIWKNISSVQCAFKFHWCFRFLNVKTATWSASFAEKSWVIVRSADNHSELRFHYWLKLSLTSNIF